MQALQGVDLQVHSGEIIGLLGANGAGKTTLIDLILGLTSPTAGKVSNQATSGAVLQTGGLLPDITVEATVRMLASTYDPPQGIEDVLEQANLKDIRKRKVGKCSGGEQQRLRFALAILGDPDLLILDEPTAGMDAMARHAFWDRMHAQAARGRTIVFSTHYLEEAQNFAQRIVVMAKGRIVADGTTAEIRNITSSHKVTAEFPDGVPAELADHIQGSIESFGNSVSISTPDSDQTARYLLTQTAAQNLTITPHSLEDSFFELTSRSA